ncbi:MAG TPA: hypothetical protein VGS11_04920 [Candidatus Bathyarchaeia archaeon]|nr:hypothetical protein [Candidatus Bathyarchaeia archaeon]
MSEVSIQLPKDRLTKDEYTKLPDYEKEHYVKNLIKQTIELNYPNGVTAKMIEKALAIDARIIDKHITGMSRTGEVYSVQFDKTTVYLPNTRALHAVLEQTFKVDDKTEFRIFQLRNRLGDFIYIQERKKRGYTEDIDKAIQVPLGKYAEFVEYQRKALTEMLKRT